MKSFSVARAYSAGVDLIERKPWTLMWWVVAIIVLQMLPRFLLPGLLGNGNEFTAVRDMWASIGNPTQLQAATQRLQQARSANQGMGLGALWLLWNLFCSALLYNAAFRSVLNPEKSQFGYLRLGAAEFWQFVTLLVQMILLVVFGCVVALVLVASVFIAKTMGAASGYVMYGLFLVITVASIWLLLRFSLGTVATFAEKRFALFHSWHLTKGRAWRLFWTSFLTITMILGLVLMFAYSLLLAFVPFASLIPSGHVASVAPLSQGPPAVSGAYTAAATALLALWLLVASILSSVLHAFTLTPWAVAYRGVTEQETN